MSFTQYITSTLSSILPYDGNFPATVELFKVETRQQHFIPMRLLFSFLCNICLVNCVFNVNERGKGGVFL